MERQSKQHHEHNFDNAQFSLRVLHNLSSRVRRRMGVVAILGQIGLVGTSISVVAPKTAAASVASAAGRPGVSSPTNFGGGGYNAEMSQFALDSSDTQLAVDMSANSTYSPNMYGVDDEDDFEEICDQAIKLSGEGDLRGAVQCWERADRINSRRLNCVELATWTWNASKLGKFKEAVNIAERNLLENPHLYQLVLLAQCYAEARDLVSARAIMSSGLKREDLPSNADADREYDKFLKANAISYWRIDVPLDAKNYTKGFNIKEDLKNGGGYETLIPSDTPYQQCRVLLSNVRSKTQIVDTAGNIRWRLVPEEIEKPVIVTFFFKTTPLFFDLRRAQSECFNVPAKYQCYTKTTENIKPDGPFAKKVQAAIAIGEFTKKAGIPVDPGTVYGKLYNLWLWSNTITYGRKWGSGSEDVIEHMSHVCDGQSYAACAVARGLGFAARPVGGFSNFLENQQYLGHNWYEIYLPGVVKGLDWIPFQSGGGVPMGQAYWNCIRFFAEPIDESSWSSVLNLRTPKDGKPWVSHAYLGQFCGFFNAQGERRVVGLGRCWEDEAFDDKLASLGIKGAQTATEMP